MRFSIIMPVLNEEAALERHLCQLARVCAPHECELLIVDGGSVDSTVAIAQRFGRVISSPRGRAAQMNRGAAAATGDILVFLHADSTLPDDAFIAIECACAAPGVVGGAFRLCFHCSHLAYLVVALATNLRSRWRGIFTGDQAIFTRRSLFDQLGGYQDWPFMEDVDFSERMSRRGQVSLLAAEVETPARRHRQWGVLKTQLTVMLIRVLYLCKVHPAKYERLWPPIR